MSRCDIIIPVWNQLEDTRNCVDSIRRNTSYPYRLIIIDNASDRETAAYLEGLKKEKELSIVLVRNEKNEGFIKAVNKGISLATAEYVCILNNDTIVTRGWLNEMVSVLNKDPLVGLVNPSSNSLGQKLPKGITPDEFAQRIKFTNGSYTKLGNALGFCMFARKKLFDEIGMLDEAFGMGNFDDTDFSLRAKEKGYKAVRAIGSYVYHREKASFKKIKRRKEDFDRNRRIFEAKWGKTKRIAYVFGNLGRNSLERIKKSVEADIKKGNWIYMYSGSREAKDFFAGHSNISFYYFPAVFYIMSFFKILFKKKKSDITYCDNAFFSRFLKIFGVLSETGIERPESGNV